MISNSLYKQLSSLIIRRGCFVLEYNIVSSAVSRYYDVMQQENEGGAVAGLAAEGRYSAGCGCGTCETG
jgi:hypothetical protein